MIYTTSQLNILETLIPISQYNKLKKVNSFINKNWEAYVQGSFIIKEGGSSWGYSLPLDELKYFDSSQKYYRDLLASYASYYYSS